MREFLHGAHLFFDLPLTHAAIGGALVAAGVDYKAFTTWKSFHDAAEYDWYTAAWRWLQGAVMGLVAGIGLAQL